MKTDSGTLYYKVVYDSPEKGYIRTVIEFNNTKYTGIARSKQLALSIAFKVLSNKLKEEVVNV